jgi:hypothetical protein
MQGMGMGIGGGRGGRQQALFPVQVMMPVGPQGAWQPVQYMMTAQQVPHNLTLVHSSALMSATFSHFHT